MSNAAFQRHGLDVIALSSHEWRVSDPDRSERGGLSLLGFVEEVAVGFEVTAIGQPGHRTVRPDLDSALQLLRNSDIRL